MPLHISPTQLKVLCLFALQSAGGILPLHVLQDVLLRCEAHCFSVLPAFEDLKNAGNMEQYDEDGEQYVRMTAQGKTVLEALKGDVPFSVREKAAAEAMAALGDLRRKIATDANVSQLPNGDYSVQLRLQEEGVTLIDTTLWAPTKLQAELIARNFREDPTSYYSEILRILTLQGKDE